MTAPTDPRKGDLHGGTDAEPDGSTPAGSLDRGKGESTPPVGSPCWWAVGPELLAVTRDWSLDLTRQDPGADAIARPSDAPVRSLRRERLVTRRVTALGREDLRGCCSQPRSSTERLDPRGSSRPYLILRLPPPPPHFLHAFAEFQGLSHARPCHRDARRRCVRRAGATTRGRPLESSPRQSLEYTLRQPV